MFRKAFLTIICAALFAAVFASPAEAKHSRAIKRFNKLGYTGVQQNYYGYLYANYARQIALSYGYDDAETGYYLYYGEQYSLAAYKRGMTGVQKQYSDFVTNAADLSNAAWQYEYNIYNYVANSIYPSNPSVGGLLEPLAYAYVYNLYAEVYYDAAVRAVTPK